jgi:hypothetical protein
MKARYKWSNASADPCLRYWHDHFPDENTCPSSPDEAKKVLYPLDLPHKKYHACINDCYIYQKEEDADKTKCQVCDAPQYKKGKRAPRKVVWYFPVIPHLQWYFTDPKEARLMRWHAKRREEVLKDAKKLDTNIVLTHPSDSSPLKALDAEYPSFGEDPRNIRLGACMDRLNPFGSQSITT